MPSSVPAWRLLSDHRLFSLGAHSCYQRSRLICPTTSLLGFFGARRKPPPMKKQKLQRTFEDVQDPVKHAQSMTVLQWNVLADGLAQFGDFERVPADVLSWESRSPQLLMEILESKSDLISLQEVNRYEDFFKPRLEQLGYTGLFWPKACSPAEQYGFPCDGCALFYRTERFEMIGPPCGLPFSIANGPSGKQGMLQVLLRDQLSGRHVIFAGTHLKAKAGEANAAARELQARQMMERLASAHQAASSNECNPENGSSTEPDRQKTPVVILCGDFNDSPTSSACQVVREHWLGLSCIWDWAAAHSTNGSVPAPFTTWKFRPDGVSQRTIDFIWFSKDPRLRLLRRWRMPTEGDIGEQGLPCERYPSDHLALCAVFELDALE
ncbi:DNase I-like protein [Coccomyxa subellipsoidea C-169]|uniref:DNase I-like protein n=1 Tax=Coccomyxa subellipsoidea (strain C-169) TaxID=574566 RepID=I0YVQ8_COCSC|nr:DNase I-like protein [Coccomyxa subellipsoidea C-169]EIE22477.1 DNase I-like protein [Coccomyxa subellipsoidea C-169]|eukprot:XP_005647021.1 DNase I-like protein [Coccomyxa subellipsoidea C-169]